MAKTIGKAVGIDEPTADAATAYAVERDQLIAEGNPPHSICLTNCGCVWCGGDSYRLSRRAQHLAQPVGSLGEARDLLIIDPGELLSFDLSVERIQRCAHRRNGGRAEEVGGGRAWGGGRGHATSDVGETAAGWAVTGHIWGYVRDDRPFAGPAPPAAVYYASRDRRGEHPVRHLASFTGILQADAYSGFNGLYEAARKPAPITPALCWAHARPGPGQKGMAVRRFRTRRRSGGRHVHADHDRQAQRC